MSKSECPFFSTPNEQIGWLRALLANDKFWCVLRVFPPQWKIEHVNGTKFLEGLQLTKEDDIGGLQLYIGRTDLVPVPIWDGPSGDRDIDVTRSQAIQFAPSMVADGQILLEGQLAIMRGIHYEKAGIDPKPLRKWFREVTKSFRQLGAGGSIVSRDLRSGEEVDYPFAIATRGAVEWQRSGHRLKQSAKGGYEFEVRGLERQLS